MINVEIDDRLVVTSPATKERTFDHDLHVVSIGEIIGVNQGLVEGIGALEFDPAAGSRSQYDGNGLPAVCVGDGLVIFVPDALLDAVVPAQGEAAVGDDRTGDELQLHVGIIDAGVVVFGVDPGQAFGARERRERTVAVRYEFLEGRDVDVARFHHRD